jgi:ParB family chromosome partitioning protein
MSNNRKKRNALLENLAAAGAPAPTTASSMMTANRALRSARDAVDAHQVWTLDPSQIEDTRLADRIDPEDVADLRDAIDANGQTVPILVRRLPDDPDRYSLIYGRRRLEAIRLSDKVDKVRALVANMDDDSALRAQISENMARRDLSFIEKALMARSLVQSGFGNQSQVAEVLTVTKSSVSMAISIVETLGEDLARRIGAAHGVGRPRWERLSRAIQDSGADTAHLTEIAHDARDKANIEIIRNPDLAEEIDISLRALEAVEKAVGTGAQPAKPPAPKTPQRAQPLSLAGRKAGSLKRGPKGLTIALEDGPFSDWLESEAQSVLTELHDRWLKTGGHS